MVGLTYTRDYRSWTYWFRAASRFVSRFTFDPLESLGVKFGLIKSYQKTLVWTRKHHHEPDLSQPCAPLLPRLPRHVSSPSIELTDYSTIPHDESANQDTPAMAHSLFPPAITTRRTRNESDASYTEPMLPIYEYYRRSEDSHTPLVQQPPDVHRSRASSSRRISGETQHVVEDRGDSEVTDERSSSEYILSPMSPPHDHSSFSGWLGLNTVQSRQGYRRANSDPGSPPFDVVAEVQEEQNALGISLSHDDSREGEDKSRGEPSRPTPQD